MNKKRLLQGIGIIGTIVCLVIFIRRPSWPTPDKLIIFLTFVFMALAQARDMLKRLLPFVALLLIYDSFRGIAPKLNTRVNYMFMYDFDKWLFGGLPTAQLQSLLWRGSVQWYDFAFYLIYMLHFVLPLALAIVIWKKRDSYYWRYVTSFVVLSFAGFITYVLYPAAPPWMSSDMGLIPHIERVSTHVWAALGIQDFPSVYNKIAPNAVAAVPSLHAAYATLFAIFVTKLFSRRWAAVAWLYPAVLYIGIVYQGDHYVFDALLGILYAVCAYYLVAWLFAKRAARKARKYQAKT